MLVRKQVAQTSSVSAKKWKWKHCSHKTNTCVLEKYVGGEKEDSNLI